MMNDNRENRSKQQLLMEWRRVLNFIPLAELFLKASRDNHAPWATESDIKSFLADVRKDTPRPICFEVLYVPVDDDGPHKHKKILSIDFGGEKISVFSGIWDDMISLVCEKVARENQEEFPRVLSQIRGSRSRRYFSESDEDLSHRYRMVSGTSIYVEWNLTANNAVALCEAIAKLFGYDSPIVEAF